MTAPALPNKAPAQPPNPKIQAVTFALQLAEVRANTAVGGDKRTSVTQLLSDAEAIAAFIGAAPPRNS
jgi:hypothetical protein